MSRPFLILSLSGGGYGGLYTARVLELLEEARGGRPLAESVDLIAGTSIGGIIALGLANGVPASKIRSEIEEFGPRVFCDSGNRLARMCKNGLAAAKSMAFPKYSSKSLSLIVQSILGGATLGNLRRPAFVTAVSLNTGNPRMFRNYARNGDDDVQCQDAAMATSAAPTYFAPYRVSGEDCVDGGIIANNPDSIAINEAQHFFGVGLDSISVMSVGTVNTDTGEPAKRRNFTGLAGQIMRVEKTIAFAMEAQQELSRSTASQLLGDRYLRIAARPNNEIAKYVRMDRADGVATGTLRNLAKSDFDGHRQHPVMRLATSPGIAVHDDWRSRPIY